MSTQTIVIIIAVLAVIAALAVRGAGPHVTQITTRREHETKDSDDA